MKFYQEYDLTEYEYGTRHFLFIVSDRYDETNNTNAGIKTDIFALGNIKKDLESKDGTIVADELDFTIDSSTITTETDKQALCFCLEAADKNKKRYCAVYMDNQQLFNGVLADNYSADDMAWRASEWSGNHNAISQYKFSAVSFDVNLLKYCKINSKIDDGEGNVILNIKERFRARQYQQFNTKGNLNYKLTNIQIANNGRIPLFFFPLLNLLDVLNIYVQEANAILEELFPRSQNDTNLWHIYVAPCDFDFKVSGATYNLTHYGYNFASLNYLDSIGTNVERQYKLSLRHTSDVNTDDRVAAYIHRGLAASYLMYNVGYREAEINELMQLPNEDISKEQRKQIKQFNQDMAKVRCSNSVSFDMYDNLYELLVNVAISLGCRLKIEALGGRTFEIAFIPISQIPKNEIFIRGAESASMDISGEATEKPIKYYGLSTCKTVDVVGTKPDIAKLSSKVDIKHKPHKEVNGKTVATGTVDIPFFIDSDAKNIIDNEKRFLKEVDKTDSKNLALTISSPPILTGYEKNRGGQTTVDSEQDLPQAHLLGTVNGSKYGNNYLGKPATEYNAEPTELKYDNKYRPLHAKSFHIWDCYKETALTSIFINEVSYFLNDRIKNTDNENYPIELVEEDQDIINDEIYNVQERVYRPANAMYVKLGDTDKVFYSLAEYVNILNESADYYYQSEINLNVPFWSGFSTQEDGADAGYHNLEIGSRVKISKEFLRYNSDSNEFENITDERFYVVHSIETSLSSPTVKLRLHNISRFAIGQAPDDFMPGLIEEFIDETDTTGDNGNAVIEVNENVEVEEEPGSEYIETEKFHFMQLYDVVFLVYNHTTNKYYSHEACNSLDWALYYYRPNLNSALYGIIVTADNNSVKVLTKGNLRIPNLVDSNGSAAWFNYRNYGVPIYLRGDSRPGYSNYPADNLQVPDERRPGQYRTTMFNLTDLLYAREYNKPFLEFEDLRIRIGYAIAPDIIRLDPKIEVVKPYYYQSS